MAILYFFVMSKEIIHDMTWKLLKKRKFKRETESLLIAAQNNAIRTNSKMPQISKSMSDSVSHDTVNHIISECSKLAQKENNTRHDWMGKVIHWELCKKLKFDHAKWWHMHKSAFVQENKTHEILWDISIQTDHQIPARRQDLELF